LGDWAGRLSDDRQKGLEQLRKHAKAAPSRCSVLDLCREFTQASLSVTVTKALDELRKHHSALNGRPLSHTPQLSGEHAPGDGKRATAGAGITPHRGVGNHASGECRSAGASSSAASVEPAAELSEGTLTAPSEGMSSPWLAELTASGLPPDLDDEDAEDNVTLETLHRANAVAKSMWGPTASPFPFQLQVVDALQCGNDVVCCLGTGAGKTATCGFIASLLPGCHVLVQPTLALQQTTALELFSLGIAVAAVPPSSKSSAALTAMTQGAIPTRAQCLHDLSVCFPGFGCDDRAVKPHADGSTFILLTTAEQLLNSKRIHKAHKKMADHIGMMFIDEAHLNDEWSHFRPDLQQLAHSVNVHKFQAVVMSATLSAEAAAAVECQLQLQRPVRVKHRTVLNASMHFVDANGLGSIPPKTAKSGDGINNSSKLAGTATEDALLQLGGQRQQAAQQSLIDPTSKLAKVAAACKETPQDRNVLVFWNRKEGCERMAAALSELVDERVAWHHSGGSSRASKTGAQTNLRQWMCSEVRIIIATVGMSVGIHNKRCGTVVIMEPPDSVSQLCQMAGRCGRSASVPGSVHLLFDRADIARKWGLIAAIPPTQSTAATVDHKLVQHSADKASAQKRLAAFHDVVLLYEMYSAFARGVTGDTSGEWLARLLADHFFCGVSVARGVDWGDQRLVDATAFVGCLRDYLITAPHSTTSWSVLKRAISDGVLSEQPTVTSRAHLGRLKSSFAWLRSAGAMQFDLERILRAAHDCGMLRLEYCAGGLARVSAGSEGHINTAIAVWLHNSVTLSPGLIVTGSPAEATNQLPPASDASNSSLPAKAGYLSTIARPKSVAQSLGTAHVLCPAGEIGRRFSAQAESDNCCFVYHSSRWHDGILNAYYRCVLCAGTGTAKATVRIDSVQNTAAATFAGVHSHPAPLEPSDDFSDAGDIHAEAAYYRLPVHPLLCSVIATQAAAATRPTPMQIEGQLAALATEAAGPATTVFESIPSAVANAGPAASSAFAASGLGQKHGLHRRRVNVETIKNKFQAVSKPDRNETHWDSFVRAIADHPHFVHKSCLGENGTTNDSWLFVQTDQMRQLSQRRSLARGGQTVTVYEDDTGGSVMFTSKLFVWMIRSPGTYFGLPLAYMLYLPGRKVAEQRSDGLVRSLVWSYKLVEERSNFNLSLTDKMMDKCSHGQAAWAIFQATKLRQSAHAFQTLLLSAHETTLRSHVDMQLEVALSKLSAVPNLEAQVQPEDREVNGADWYGYAQAASCIVQAFSTPAVIQLLDLTSSSIQTAADKLVAASKARLFLCHFHALKATHDNLMSTVTVEADRIKLSWRLKALFRAQDLSDMHSVLESIRTEYNDTHPKVYAYLSKNWCSDKWLPMWAKWERHGRDMDHTTNLVESHWNVLKYKVFGSRLNRNPHRLFAQLVGLHDSKNTGGLIGFMFRREQSSVAGAGEVKKLAAQRNARIDRGTHLYDAHRSSWDQRKSDGRPGAIRMLDAKRMFFSVESSGTLTTGSGFGNCHIKPLQYFCTLGNASSATCNPVCDCRDGAEGRCKHVVACALFAAHELRIDGYEEFFDVGATNGRGSARPRVQNARSVSTDEVPHSETVLSIPAEVLESAVLVDKYFESLRVKRKGLSVEQEVRHHAAAVLATQSGDGRLQPDSLMVGLTSAEEYAAASQGTGHHARKQRRGAKRERSSSGSSQPRRALRLENAQKKRAIAAAGSASSHALCQASAQPTPEPVDVAVFTPSSSKHVVQSHDSSIVALRKVPGGFTLVPESICGDAAAAAPGGVLQGPANQPQGMKSKKTHSHPVHNKNWMRGHIRLAGDSPTLEDRASFGVGSIVCGNFKNMKRSEDGTPITGGYGIVTDWVQEQDDKPIILHRAIWFTPEGQEIVLTEDDEAYFRGEAVNTRRKIRHVVPGKHTPEVISTISVAITKNLPRWTSDNYAGLEKWVLEQAKRATASFHQ